MSEIATPLPRRRHWLWIALFASLAVNLSAIAWIATSWITDPGSERRASAARTEFHYRSALRALPPDQRAAVERIWKDRVDERRARYRAWREARADLRRVLTADQMEAQALEAAIASFRVRADAVQDHLSGTLTRVATTLPPDARKAYFSAGLSRPARRRSEDATPRQ